MGRSSGVGVRTWWYPAVGVLVAFGLTLVPGGPFAAARWPAAGPFGAFTWAAWLVSTSLTVTLGLLAVRLAFRRSADAPRIGRVALGFGMLAALAYMTSARVQVIERHPLAALGLAVAAALALRLLNRAAARAASSPPPDASRDDDLLLLESEDADDEAREPATPRWANVLATLTAIALVLVVALGTAVRWLGPGLGLVVPAERPTPIFWGETSYFEYDAARRAGKPIEPYLVVPTPGTPAAVRRGVLPTGAKLAIKGWVENGAEVRVEHDPEGRLAGEWGYVRLNDLSR